MPWPNSRHWYSLYQAAHQPFGVAALPPLESFNTGTIKMQCPPTYSMYSLSVGWPVFTAYYVGLTVFCPIVFKLWWPCYCMGWEREEEKRDEPKRYKNPSSKRNAEQLVWATITRPSETSEVFLEARGRVLSVAFFPLNRQRFHQTTPVFLVPN